LKGEGGCEESKQGFDIFPTGRFNAKVPLSGGVSQMFANACRTTASLNCLNNVLCISISKTNFSIKRSTKLVEKPITMPHFRVNLILYGAMGIS